jgi:predicted Zn-dependent protease
MSPVCLYCGAVAHPVVLPGTLETVPAPARDGPTRRHFMVALAGAGGAVLTGCAPGFLLVSEEQVEQLGLETWERIRRETPVSREQDRQQTAQAITRDLLLAAGEDPAAWEVVVFARPEANAFAIPGNKIGVFDGMFELVADAPQLAAVIGHEIGHNQAQHAVERISRVATAQLGLQLVSVALRIGNIGYANEIAGALGAGVQYGVILPYTRRQELEADEIGLFLMARAGYDPRAAIALWEAMRQAPGPRPPEFLSTHPAPDARIAQLERLMPAALDLYRPA